MAQFLLRRLCLSAGVRATVQRSYMSFAFRPLLLTSGQHVTSSRGVTTSCSAVASSSKSRSFEISSLLLNQLKNLSSTSDAEALAKVNEEIASCQTPSKNFCVVHIGGRQFKITTNDLIVVNKIPADIGSEIYLEKVLLAGSENFTLIGKPILSSDVVRVKATVTEHTKTAKVIVFKKKRRTTYKRKKGHRQDVTILRINDIHLSPNLS